MKKFRELSGKLVVAMLAVTLLIGCAIGGTVAWLTAKTDPVINTFTYGDINITLAETTGNDYKIIPGVNIDKNPEVTVKKDSEACWLFVKVEKAGTFVDGKVTYSIADGWTALTGQTGVYYREVPAAAADSSFYILAGDTTYPNGVVKVSENLTKAEVNAITAENQPTLTFTAYAVQKDGIDTVEAAWEKVSPSTTTP